jgi:xanthine dehydrogenase YagT iron-sulfur-binding subunit
MHDDDKIETIEGVGNPEALHPLQAAFIEHARCNVGIVPPGKSVLPSACSPKRKRVGPAMPPRNVASRRIALSDAEIRERMSGNICRCAAYPNIVAAIRDVAGEVGR